MIKKKAVNAVIICLFLGIVASITVAHDGIDDGHPEPILDVEKLYPLSTWTVLVIGVGAIALFTVISIIGYDKLSRHAKKILFISVSIVVMLVTFYFIGTTLYVNTVSETRGPIHWHADFEIWDCGTKIDLINPKGISNKVGTPLLHEHNDDRIHVEGKVISKSDLSLSNFFTAFDGVLLPQYLAIPTGQGTVERRDGELCNGRPGKVQIFVYSVEGGYATQHDNFAVSQRKITEPDKYILSPFSNVPPGDCIIIEFDEEKERTDKICKVYEVKQQKGELRFT